MSNKEKIVYKRYIVNEDSSDDSDDDDEPSLKQSKRQKNKNISKPQKKQKKDVESEDEEEFEDEEDDQDDEEFEDDDEIQDEDDDEIEDEDDDEIEDEDDDKIQEEDDDKIQEGDEADIKKEDDENYENSEDEKEEMEKEVLYPQENKLNRIKNREKRQSMVLKLKLEKRKAKRELKKQKKKEEAMGIKRKPKPMQTIESKREIDETEIGNDDDDLITEEATDQYADYYSMSYEPKVLITASDRIHGTAISFLRELGKIIPNSSVYWRKKASVKNKIAIATKNGYTDMIVINEDNRVPTGLLLIHLGKGPTALFRLSNVKTCKTIRRNSRDITGHRPELILNNFKTRLGRLIARMFGALFHYEPEFKARSVCTLHNQRDYIFFRHHRYQFRNSEKVSLRELGPRFTLRLEWLREGVFEGDFEWVLKRKEMETSRTKFNL